VRATSAFVRLFVRGLAWDAGDAGASFDDTLKAAARAKLTDSGKGKVLVGTTAGGASVTYTLPPLGDLTGQDVADVCSTLLDKVDVLRAATPAITDAELLAALLAAYPTIRAMRPDFSTGLCR
jgi:hypothetical protein